MKAALVAADLEGTLTTGESWKGMAEWMRRNGRKAQYQAFFNRHLGSALLAKLGLINKRAFQDRFMLGAVELLSGLTERELEQVGEWVVEHELWPKRRKAVLDEVNKVALVVLCSATFQPILQAFARRMGPGVVALGTPLQMQEGVFTGRIEGQVRSGQAKATGLRQWLGRNRLDAAYGDTWPDKEMLELSQNPVAVYPDAQLLRHAQSKGWRVIR